MKEINLSQGKVAIVDDDDYERLSQFKWCASYDPDVQDYYAMRRAKDDNGTYRSIYMAREILGLGRGDKRHGDHINHCTLDNRKENLRIATASQSAANRRAHRRGSSGFIGVSYFGKWSKTSPWKAQIGKDYGKQHIGLFQTAEDAARAYDKAAKELHGQFACLNFPVEQEESYVAIARKRIKGAE